MEDLFIPTLHTFENENIFTGSLGNLRFKITPVIPKNENKEKNWNAATMCAEVWHGMFCYEKSEIESEQSFPLTAEGREAMCRWLKESV